MTSIETKIILNEKVAKDFYKLRFLWKKEWGAPVAGNFCEIKTNDLSAPLLRRPFAFSAYDESKDFAEIIYQKRGTATDILSKKREGENLPIIAPLGNSFYENISQKKRVFAVAGGVGLGPILFAVKTSPLPAFLVAGFRDKDFVPENSVFAETNSTICTDDGSDGFSGNVVQFLKTTDITGDDLIIACGPTPMLKALHDFAAEKNIECRVSMEEMMACGVGACMGCVILACDEKYRRVCKEGPVFDSRGLRW